MRTVKGLVIRSRFEYFEEEYGQERYRDFLKKVSTNEENYERQPVVGSNSYPESTLAKIDDILLEDYFNGDTERFRELGKWNAENMMPRFFYLYIQDQKPEEFLFQYCRLRPFLIGAGIMEVSRINQNSLMVKIDYEQNIPRSVCLSEQGFLSEGMKLCGLKQITILENTCAAQSEGFICSYQININ